LVRFISFALFILIALVSLTVGCSSRGINPVAPSGENELLPAVDEESSGRTLWGIWDIELDLEKMTALAISSRDIEAHINVTSLIPQPLITVLGYDPVTQIVNVIVTISNPSSLNGYDVRLILFTNDEGLRLTNDDGWTDLYDKVGGKSQNPFRAYAKYEANRIFSAHSQQTEQLLIFLPSPSGLIRFAVDASFPGNCPEPYQIQNFTQTPLYDSAGSSSDLTVQVYDWQNDINAVKINAYEITGVYYTTFAYQATQGNWMTTITNVSGKPAGKYECLLMAMSNNSGYLAMYDFVDVTITQTPCPIDSNNTCSYADKIYMHDSVSGCIDQNDNNDWYYFYAPPAGVQSGTLTLQYTGVASYMFVYGLEQGGTCPGTMLASGSNINLSASANSLYYILITGAAGRSDYQFTINITPAISNVPCEIYVARDSSGHWPIWEAPNPDIELTITHLQNQMNWTNLLWNQFGYNLVWDGTVTFMASKYYVLNNNDEAWEMHSVYGAGTNKVSMYFCDVLDGGVQTAYATPLFPRSQHTVNNVFSAYSTNVWYWQQAISHEQGHILGYYFDQYIFDLEGVACGDEGGLPGGYPTYLYSDPEACYPGNLMWYYYDGWTWNKFDITKGQEDYINSFHYSYNENFPWY